MRKSCLVSAFAVASLFGSAASAQSITTGFDGGVVVNSTTGNNGNMFDFVADNPLGLILDSFDVHSRAAAGTQIEVEVYYKSGTFSGFETDPSAWTLAGSAIVSAAGPLNPTPVPVGGITVPGGELFGIYLNIVTEGASVRYNSAATTPGVPVSNPDATLHVEASSAIGGLFGPSIFNPRGVNTTVHYTVIPTPAPLAVLGMGSLLALRRRR